MNILITREKLSHYELQVWNCFKQLNNLNNLTWNYSFLIKQKNFQVAREFTNTAILPFGMEGICLSAWKVSVSHIMKIISDMQKKKISMQIVFWSLQEYSRSETAKKSTCSQKYGYRIRLLENRNYATIRKQQSSVIYALCKTIRIGKSENNRWLILFNLNYRAFIGK